MKNDETNTSNTSLPCTNLVLLQKRDYPWIGNASTSTTQVTSVIVVQETSAKKKGKAIIVVPNSTHFIVEKVQEKIEVDKSTQYATKGGKMVEPSKLEEIEMPMEKETM